MNKILCIHHTDLDGAASAAVVGLAHQTDQVTYIKYNFGQELKPEWLGGYDKIYAVDISFRDEPWVYELPNLIWIDHHKTAIDSYQGPSLPGLRKIGKGACELCWEYFFPDQECPELIQYLSTYDVWDKARFNWEIIEKIEWGAKAKYGIDPALIIYDLVRSIEPNSIIIDDLRDSGELILNYQTRVYKSRLKEYGMEFPNFFGYRVLAMCTQDFTAKTFEAQWDPEKYDIMMPFCFHPAGFVRCSLYTSKDEIDCSSLAAYLGGGGHRGAAGFQISWESFYEFLKSSEPLKA